MARRSFINPGGFNQAMQNLGFVDPSLRPEMEIEANAGRQFLKDPDKKKKIDPTKTPTTEAITGRGSTRGTSDAADPSVAGGADIGTTAGLDTSALSGFGIASTLAGAVTGPVGLAADFTRAMNALGFTGVVGAATQRPSVNTPDFDATVAAQNNAGLSRTSIAAGTKGTATGVSRGTGTGTGVTGSGGATRSGSAGDGSRGPSGGQQGGSSRGGAERSGDAGDGNRG